LGEKNDEIRQGRRDLGLNFLKDQRIGHKVGVKTGKSQLRDRKEGPVLVCR